MKERFLLNLVQYYQVSKASVETDSFLSAASFQETTKVLTDAGVSMDTFKDTLIKNAKESGVAIDEWIAADGSFENTLQRGWLKDSDITKAFEDLAKGTSGATLALSLIHI